MKKFILIPIIWLALVPCTAGAESFSEHFSIAIPPDKAIIESEMISIVLRLKGNALDQFQILVNNRNQQLVAKPYNQHYACKDGIQLSHGINKIKVLGLKDGKKVEEANTQVFYGSDLTQSSIPVPPGFKKYSFHDDAYEKVCVPCHNLDFGKADTNVSSTERSPCYKCHKAILSKYAFVHGPAAVWSCLECHDGKSRNPKLVTLKPDGKVCMNCHENSWDSKKHLHGPTAAGSCTTCHNPHASNNSFFLRLPTGDLCIACHEEVLLRPHILTSFSANGGHPVRKYPDPFNPGREFNCASCHNPHASDSPVFLNGYDNSMPMNHFCMTCHRM